ncbi:YtxH domain-containing protein [Shouchella shacheensis]|uniref:YtxH domain-containing protein n=1 Tax=Shouchella shacheensis TaxID=1649580 RepID=UPI0007404996|nr:YtxH domain-containing protein [Shouchella shacheensis]
MGIKAIFTGLAAGTIIAGTAVLLTTPHSGKYVRQASVTTYQTSRQTLKQLSADVKEIGKEAKKTIELSKSVGTQTAKELKTSVETWKNEAQPSIEALSGHVKSAQDQVHHLNESLKN